MAEFVTAYTGTVKMKVPTADGNIAQSGDTENGAKQVSIPGIKAGATLAEANIVFGKFVGTICGGSFDSLSAVKTVTQGVAE